MIQKLDFGNIKEQAFALGNAERLTIINHLRDHPRSVSDLLMELEITQSTLSHHLKILRKTGLVTGIRDGRHVYYAIRREGLSELINDLGRLSDQIPVSAQILPSEKED